MKTRESMKNFSIAILILMNVSLVAQVQESIANERNEEAIVEINEDSLKALALVMMRNQDVDLRLEASEKFIDGLLGLLEEEGSFGNSYDSLFNVSKIYPQDSTFRIMTWQLYVDVDEYKYFGIIQTKGNKKQDPKVFRLEDYSARMRSPDHITLNKDNWYGALYYNMKEFKSKGGKKYLLFGFDAYKFFEKRKLLEVLSFDKDGEPVFGAPVIEHTKKRNNVPPETITYHRFILQYSSKTSINLNFNDLEDKVLFDHLISMGSGIPDIPYVMIPDGSYEGFELRKGMWVHVEKVFDHMYEQGEFPRPMPVLDDRKGKSIIDK